MKKPDFRPTDGVCPNCSGSGLEPVSLYGKHMSCLACDGTGDISKFLYNLMAGEIERDGLGWGPAFNFWYVKANR